MIITINGSGKPRNSNSAYFLDLVKQELWKANTYESKSGRCDKLDGGNGAQGDYVDLTLSGIDDIRQTARNFMNCVGQCEKIIFAMPLFVDGVPSNVLRFFEEIDSFDKDSALHGKRVYVIANCGFYEGEQNRNLLDIMRCWCEKKEMIWGRGIGIGAGEMMGSMKAIPYGKGPTKNLRSCLSQFADSVRKEESGEHIFVRPNLMSQNVFILFANQFWGMIAKKNGLTKKALLKKMV